MDRDSDIERRARAIVVARTVYKSVLLLWALFIIGMVIIWWTTTPDGYFWPIWPFLGLGVAALVWGLVLYRKFPFRVSEDKIAREARRLRESG